MIRDVALVLCVNWRRDIVLLVVEEGMNDNYIDDDSNDSNGIANQ